MSKLQVKTKGQLGKVHLTDTDDVSITLIPST